MIRAGIDIGADSIRLVKQGEGIVFDEPCMVALDTKGNALAIGIRALEMKSRADEEVKVIAPFQSDPIDFSALDALLEQLCYDFKIFRFLQKTVLLVSYPTILPKQTAQLLKDHLLALGADTVYFDEEIWMAAIGSRLDLYSPVGSCVMNIGYSNCDIAVFSNGRLLKKSSSELNGKSVSRLISQYLKRHFNILVSDSALDKIKRKLGNTRIRKEPVSLEVKGLDATTYIMKSIVIDENQIASVLAPLVREWAAWIQKFIYSLPQSCQQDIYMRGIVCSGGTMKLKGLADSLKTLVGCPVFVTDKPVETVSAGLQILMDRME